MDNLDTVSPKEFDNKLLSAEKNFTDPDTKVTKIPVVIYVDKTKQLPWAIKKNIKDLPTQVAKVEGEIIPSPRVLRHGFRVSKYLSDSEGETGVYFRLSLGNRGVFDIPIDSVTGMEIQMSEHMSGFPLKVENPAVEESAGDPFVNFLDSLKRTKEDDPLIENVKNGYNICTKNKE